MAIWGSNTNNSTPISLLIKQKLYLFKKKLDLYYMITIVFLCSISYLYGSYRRPTNTSSIFPKVTNTISCLTPTDSTRNLPTKLDFTSTHSASDLIKLTPLARVTHVPPCHVNFSEYTPCQDVERSLRFPRERLVYRERHCPDESELLTCRVPAPFGYKSPFRWPDSRDMVWYANVPHKWLTVEKAVQNWVRFENDRFVFPGGGTMFPRGADAYIDEIGKIINLKDGSVRTAIDTGCGVASFGAYLLSRDILTVSFAPKDTHEAQVQFALERGVPALIGIMATNRLPYPSRSFDMAHCSRCLIPWSLDEGLYLIEVDRILRPGGYWILSGPPINWEAHWQGWNRTKQDLGAEQSSIENVARSLCWKKLKQKGDLSIWQKPTNHIHCKKNRKVFKKPRFCDAKDPDQAWYTKMEPCLTPLPEVSTIAETAGGKLTNWPERLTTAPPRVNSGSLAGITPESFNKDSEMWKERLAYYRQAISELNDKGRYRNVIDMNANLGGFAAALVDYPVWVMNVVPVEAKVDTLGAIFERGLIGTYQNWCEAMSTYPRTYDLIHADSVFSLYEGRCKMEDILLEMDRILRPQGCVILRDDVDVVTNVKNKLEGMQYNCRIVDHENGPIHREKIMVAIKEYWTAPQVINPQQLS
ncbi:putative methyltransferase PMT15 [Silene latifolia]|uniref:putative methyltransferase PMT15 n=1 Tax=Silene latifolia TaxID=37657 RepID=UPI003D7794B7